jgi:hypothetical protein
MLWESSAFRRSSDLPPKSYHALFASDAGLEEKRARKIKVSAQKSQTRQSFPG